MGRLLLYINRRTWVAHIRVCEAIASVPASTLRLERHGQVVVRPRVVRLLLDRALEPERGLAPQSSAGDGGSECDLGLRLVGAGVGRAAGGNDRSQSHQREFPHHVRARIFIPPVGRLL